MLTRCKLIPMLLGLCMFFGCQTNENPDDAVSDNTENLDICYSVGQSYLTTRTMLTEEETAEGAVKIYKYDRYFTVVDALDSENTPVAGRRMYEESFFEVSGQRSLRGTGVFQGKAIIFKPDSIPSVEGNPVEDKYTSGLRLTGFEHIFLPARVRSDKHYHLVELAESEKRIMRNFLTQLGIVPDKSVISVKVARSTEQNVELQFIWNVSGIILEKKGVGVRLKFSGKIKYSREYCGITYFELVQSSDNDKNSTLRLIINRDFTKTYKNGK